MTTLTSTRGEELPLLDILSRTPGLAVLGHVTEEYRGYRWDSYVLEYIDSQRHVEHYTLCLMADTADGAEQEISLRGAHMSARYDFYCGKVTQIRTEGAHSATCLELTRTILDLLGRDDYGRLLAHLTPAPEH